MDRLSQTPGPGEFLLRWAGDLLEVTLDLETPRPGRAVFRTNIGRAAVRRRELAACTESGEPMLARDWHDIPMRQAAPGRFSARIPLTEVGIFAGKACFFPEGGDSPQWPEGGDLRVKVEPAHTACANTMYTAFVRQFRPAPAAAPSPAPATAAATGPAAPGPAAHESALDSLGYTVIPPGGTFRDLIARLDTIMGEMRFRILQLLPIHPVPTTFARMGRFGSAFACLDFLSVDPALAVFDRRATPLDQFRELADAVHCRAGTLFLDIPANHTGWAATLQTHHPEWYRRRPDGEFVSPGAWGVTWADLVELDYSDPALRAYMADVFLFWCANGADGFRCDAGYMIPEETWAYIVARVRDSYPDTVFLLEGLGGGVDTTERLLRDADLNWAYSELFQTEDRRAMEWYLPRAFALSESCGPLIHFAETHDNDRLAARGRVYARMRVAISALLSHEGAFGMANGVEWFAAEKIDVHGAPGLNWGAAENQVAEIARLNTLLSTHPSFGPGTRLRPVQRGAGNVLAVLREPAPGAGGPLLVLANLDCSNPATVHWDPDIFTRGTARDLLTGHPAPGAGEGAVQLAPGQVLCLTAIPETGTETGNPETGAPTPKTETGPETNPDPNAPGAPGTPAPAPCRGIPAIARRRRNLMALRVRAAVGAGDESCEEDPDALGAALAADPAAFCAAMARSPFPPCALWEWPADLRRQVPVPAGHLLLALADDPFKAALSLPGGRVAASDEAVRLDSGHWGLFLKPEPEEGADPARLALQTLELTLFTPGGLVRRRAEIAALPPGRPDTRINRAAPGREIRAELSGRPAGHAAAGHAGHAAAPAFFTPLHAALSNAAGAMAFARAAWGSVRGKYDCLLGLNPNPGAPADKIIFWTRCRAWLRRSGYSQEIGPACLDRFEADPAGRFAVWSFNVPCGMGRRAPLSFRLDLEPGRNRARLAIRRGHPAPGPGAAAPGNAAGAVTLILRPDIEWRRFHDTTKAYTGPEKAWPAAVRPLPDGFLFSPAGAPPGLGMSLPAGRFHPAPEWAYMTPYPEEAERGLDAAGDLFSPGWFELPLEEGASAGLVAGEDAAAPFPQPGEEYGQPTQSKEKQNTGADTEQGAEQDAEQDAGAEQDAPGPRTRPTADVLSDCLSLFIVRRDGVKTVIAGYPWFLDWGRDTLIAARGLIAAGRLEDARNILIEFGRFEDQGTLPNTICGETVANRDTSDAPLWFCIAAGDLERAAGPGSALDAPCGPRPLRDVILSILDNNRDGTPNGIRMDPETALLYSPPHFTWMDTNYPAATPREGYPVEIQALWIAALRLAARLIDPSWAALAGRASAALARLFPLPDGGLADCLRARPGTPARGAAPEDAVRPNQLLAVTLGALGDNALERSTVAACGRLLIPGAIRSLADRPVSLDMGVRLRGALLNNPFAPYKGTYRGDEDTLRKPAYHNGTAWSWLFPSYVEACLRAHGPRAREACASLLASAVARMNLGGCLCQIPEIFDGDAPHTARGCSAQAWGISELLRVWRLLWP